MSALLAYEAKRTGRPVGAPAQASLSPVPAPTGTGESGGGKEELLAAWDHLVDHEANRKPVVVVPPPAWRRFVLPIVALVATLGALYLTVARPTWLYPVTIAAPRAINDAAAEHYAVTAAMLAEEFVEEFGRLPNGLAELGLEIGGAVFVNRGDGLYQIRVRGPSQTFIIEGNTRGEP
jgi:hypothetical protein